MKNIRYTILIFSSIILISILMLTLIHGNPPTVKEVEYDVPDEVIILCQKLTSNDSNYYSKLFVTAVDLNNNEMIIMGYTFEPGPNNGSSKLEFFKRTGIKVNLDKQKDYQVSPHPQAGSNFFKSNS